jgi:aspartate racemase
MQHVRYSGLCSSLITHYSFYRGASLKNIGVIGGVGPLATTLYYRSLVDEVVTVTRGKLPGVIMYSLPIDAEIEQAFIQGYDHMDKEINLRTRCIISQAVETFVQAGIKTVAMPCNTLQPLLEDICDRNDVYNINLIQETSKRVRKREVSHALIIGTNETCRSNMYGRMLENAGIRYQYLEEDDQRIVALHISASLRAPQEESPYLNRFLDCIVRASRDVDGLVIACTDLTGHLLSNLLKIPVIDSLQALVDRSVEYVLS